VIPLGLRLAIRGGRETVIRLAVLIAAVGLGTGLLLTTVAGINAVNIQNDASAWLWTGNSLEPPGPTTQAIAPLWWHVSGDEFAGQVIARADVAATGPSSPVPPGIPRDPGPGQYYASPALAALLRGTPADELADRYPGHLVGTIGDSVLQAPNSLVIIVGRTPAQLARTPDTVRVTAIATGFPGFAKVLNRNGLWTGPPIPRVQASGIDLILSVVALAILVPVLIFTATATRLSAARREQRFAAMRLVGATRRQVSLIAAMESMVAATGGVAAGFGIFFLLRVPLASIPFTGHPFFPAQMSLSTGDVLVVALGVPVAAAVVARLALRRVHVSPLGVTRRVTPKAPTAWRLLPLLAGVAELGFFMVRGHPASASGQVQAFVPGFGLIVIGLMIAGPWLTMTGARFMARRASRPAAVIAARRLADDPRSAFRAVSGLVVALFVITVAVSGMYTDSAKLVTPNQSAAAANVLADQLVNTGDYEGPGYPASQSAPSAAELAGLHGIGGVTGILEVRTDGALTLPARLAGAGVSAGLVSCAQLASVRALGRCPAGADVAAFPAPLNAFDPKDIATITWPAERVTGQGLKSLGLSAVDVATNGSQRAIERARTMLEIPDAAPVAGPPTTLGEAYAGGNALQSAYQQLANVVILTSLAIAGCTLAASIAAGLADRKRPFSMLRLTGARLATLRRAVALESAVPLLVVAAVSIGVGFGASAMYASAEIQHPLAAPGAQYYVFVAAGLAASLAIIAATFPLLRRITGPEVARND
jgi:hypothetical protein